MSRTYNLNFDTICSDSAKEQLPKYSGIYVVYKGAFDKDGKIRPEKIVYIGEAEDIYSRHNDEEHEHYQDFVKLCDGVQHIFYKCAKVLGGERERVENALIYKLQPSLNIKGKDSFPYATTTIISSGKHALIPEAITVNDTRWSIDV